MRRGWKYHELDRHIKLIDYRGRTPQKTDSGIRLITAKNIKLGYLQREPEEFIAEDDYEGWMTRGIPKLRDVLFTTEAPLANVAQLNTSEKVAFAQRTIIMQPDEEVINQEFLKYTLLSPQTRDLIFEKSTGATVIGIKSRLLKKIPIPIPPLPEQQQIVSILDRAFATIDQAKANLERNIENARELFQSKLNEIFSQQGEGWEERTFGELIKMRSGDGLIAKNMIPGEYPVYGGNGIAGYHDEFNLDGENLIIGRVGALCGNVRLLNEKIWLTDNAFRVTEIYAELDKEFLMHLLNFKELRSYARQAAQPVISNSSLKDVVLRYPKLIDDQRKYVDRIKNLSTQLDDIVGKYDSKLTLLEELKKSILQRAFSGELTKDFQIEEELAIAAEPEGEYKK